MHACVYTFMRVCVTVFNSTTLGSNILSLTVGLWGFNVHTDDTFLIVCVMFVLCV